jgi:hypothetical protein
VTELLVAIGAACAGRGSLWSVNYPDVIMVIASINLASINLASINLASINLASVYFASIYFASICLASNYHPYF